MERRSIEQWRGEFNEARQQVRIVALLSPTCLVCQYGQGVVRSVFEVIPEENLRGFVAWMPIMDADSVDAASVEAATFTDARTFHGWDGDRVLGRAIAEMLGLEGTAWDVYLLYGPGVAWCEDTPPVPTFWMHQLPTATGADPALLLDPGRLALEASALLGRDPKELPADLQLFLHAKGLSAIKTARTRPTFEQITAAALSK